MANKYVYQLRFDWYEEAHVYGIYSSAEKAREAAEAVMQQVLPWQYWVKVDGYKWEQWANDEQFNKRFQTGELRIVRVKLDAEPDF